MISELGRVQLNNNLILSKLVFGGGSSRLVRRVRRL